MKRFIFGVLASGCLAVAQADTSSRMDVEITFDKYKGQIYALYARALKEQPGLKGRIDLEISIATTGATTDCRVISSELGAPDLERKICEKVRTWRFSPRPDAVKVNKPIDFFPAA